MLLIPFAERMRKIGVDHGSGERRGHPNESKPCPARVSQLAAPGNSFTRLQVNRAFDRGFSPRSFSLRTAACLLIVFLEAVQLIESSCPRFLRRIQPGIQLVRIGKDTPALAAGHTMDRQPAFSLPALDGA